MAESLKLLLFFMLLARTSDGQEKLATPYYENGKLMYNVPFTPEEIEALRIKSIDYDQCKNGSKSLADQITDWKDISARKETVIDTLQYSVAKRDSIIKSDSSHFVAFKDEIGLWQQIDSMNTDYIGQLTWQKTEWKIATGGSLIAALILAAKIIFGH